MRILLDTHIALWTIADSPRLSAKGRATIADAEIIYLSTVSLWEIAIKHAVKRRSMPVSATKAREYFEAAGFTFLSIAPEHALAVEELPMLHTDPFDRMLVGQALTEPLRLLTHDRQIAAYSDTVILV